jgi:hypothetical protein
MRHAFLWALALPLALACGEPAQAQVQAPGSSIVGVWKLTSFVRKEVGSDKATPPFGENPSGYRVHTHGGHAFYMFVDASRKAPAGSVTDADRVDLYKTMTAATGTYTVDGDKLVFRAEVSSGQAMTGKSLTYRFQIAGRTLTMTTDPSRSAPGGPEVFFVTTYERVE